MNNLSLIGKVINDYEKYREVATPPPGGGMGHRSADDQGTASQAPQQPAEASTVLRRLQTFGTDFSGLDSLTTIGGRLYFLCRSEGLESLESIGGDMYVEYNYCSNVFRGLRNLTSIGGDLTVYENPALDDFTGLENLSTIGESLYIDTCDDLADVTALHGITSVGTDFTVTNNPSLSTADVETLRLTIGSSNIGGSSLVSGNAP